MLIPVRNVVVLSTGETFVDIPGIERCPRCELSLRGGVCLMCGWPSTEDEDENEGWPPA